LTGPTRIVVALLSCSLWTMGAVRLDASAQSFVSLSDSAKISLITVLPGDAIYSLFGHSALRVYDREQDIDYSFSYGTFHFDDPLFVPKFIRGDLDYFLSVARFGSAVQLYREVEGRPVIEQVLSLDPHQRDQLYQFLQMNAQPENRYYRYDFLFDNCSTRIRDALESVLGSEVRFSDSSGGYQSFRELLAPYLRGRSFVRFGIGLLLGARVDRPASERETTFLPDYLSESFDRATLVDTSGTERGLVASRDTIVWIPSYSSTRRASHRAGIVLAIALLVLTVVTLREARRGVLNERVDLLLFGIVGLVGCFLVFMWVGTAHRVTAVNWNLAWAWPTHIVYAALLARKGLSRLLHRYATLTGTAMVVLVVTWGLVPQDLPEPALAIAIMMAIRGTWTALYARTVSAGGIATSVKPSRS